MLSVANYACQFYITHFQLFHFYSPWEHQRAFENLWEKQIIFSQNFSSGCKHWVFTYGVLYFRVYQVVSLGGAAPLGDGGRGTWALYLVSSRHFLDGGVVGGVCSEQFCDGFFYIGGGDSCSWWHGVVFWSVLRLIGFCFLGPCACFPLVGFVFCLGSYGRVSALLRVWRGMLVLLICCGWHAWLWFMFLHNEL